MPETRTDFVIQISATGAVPPMDAESAQTVADSVIAELERCLKPGTEIGLVLGDYIAITSILWLSTPTLDKSLRAGVRLVGISARPLGHLDPLHEREKSEPLSLRNSCQLL